MRIKVCGLCSPEDAALAGKAGADYLGVILSPGYSRSQAPAEAAEILDAAPRAARVGVFVDVDPVRLIDMGRRLRLDVLQLHGEEPPETIRELRGAGDWHVWKAIRPRGRAEFLTGLEAYETVVDAILLDGWSRVQAGGTGARFPWQEIARVQDRVPAGVRLVAAGGLGPENIAEAIACLRPDVVDVSSGVEEVVGRKSASRVRAFISNAREAAMHGSAVLDT